MTIKSSQLGYYHQVEMKKHKILVTLDFYSKRLAVQISTDLTYLFLR